MSLICKVNKIGLQNLKIIRGQQVLRNSRLLCSKVNETNPTTNTTPIEDSSQQTAKGGFARAFEKYTAPPNKEIAQDENQTFASLLRNSKFIDVSSKKKRSKIPNYL